MARTTAQRSDTARPRRATYQNVLDAPAHMVAEIIDGTRYTHPRPAPAHTLASSALGGELGNPFQFGRGGPGRWWILDEPELHLGDDIVVPNLAGWPTDCTFLLDHEIDEESRGDKKKLGRYRGPDEVRDKVLARLSALNAQRISEEVRMGTNSPKRRMTGPARYGPSPWSASDSARS